MLVMFFSLDLSSNFLTQPEADEEETAQPAGKVWSSSHQPHEGGHGVGSKVKLGEECDTGAPSDQLCEEMHRVLFSLDGNHIHFYVWRNY